VQLLEIKSELETKCVIDESEAKEPVLKEGKKRKVIPVIGRGGPYGCETSRLPHFVENRLTDERLLCLLSGHTLNPRKTPGTNFAKGSIDPRDIVRLKGLGQLINPITSPGFEPATFHLLA
jgi:hypothetical protein